MPALAEYQQQFVAALLNAAVPVPVGFTVYRNTVFKGLVDALLANYPTVERLVGPEWFAACARDYVVHHLPTEAPLALYGETFPIFLADCLATAAWSSEMPYLAGVAQLDRCWLEAYFAADVEPLTAQHLAVLPSDALSDLQLTLHPAARILRCSHSALTIWQHNQPSMPSPATLEVDFTDEVVLMTRPQGNVLVTELSPTGYLLMNLLQAASTLGEAAMQVLAVDANADVAGLLAQCINAGAFVSFSGGSD